MGFPPQNAPQGPPPENMAMDAALQQGGEPEAPMPGIPPELMELAKALGLDINNPQDLAMLIQLLGQGGGGPLGPMAGAPPSGGGGQAPPQSY